MTGRMGGIKISPGFAPVCGPGECTLLCYCIIDTSRSSIFSGSDTSSDLGVPPGSSVNEDTQLCSAHNPPGKTVWSLATREKQGVHILVNPLLHGWMALGNWGGCTSLGPHKVWEQVRDPEAWAYLCHINVPLGLIYIPISEF